MDFVRSRERRVGGARLTSSFVLVLFYGTPTVQTVAIVHRDKNKAYPLAVTCTSGATARKDAHVIARCLRLIDRISGTPAVTTPGKTKDVKSETPLTHSSSSRGEEENATVTIPSTKSV